MEKIILKHVKKVDFLAITKEQCQRALALLDAGEEVCFVPETGGYATISPDGLMRVEGIEVVSDFFDVEHKDGYIDSDATFTNPLKKRVKKVVFSAETKVICLRAFEDYTNLCEIEIPDTLERIVSPFENCPRLQPYALPSSLTYLCGDAFGIFPDEVVVPSGVEDIEGLFKESTVKKVTLSGGVKRIGMRNFYRCKHLESITLDEGLEEIASEAFSGCEKLTRIVFPKSLKYVDGFAFSHCTSLEEVVITGDTEIHPDAFFDSPMHKKLQRLRFDRFEPVTFTGDTADVPDFDSIKARLSGLALSEQAMHLALLSSTSVQSYSYGAPDDEKQADDIERLAYSSEVENVIVAEGVIVGAVIDGVRVMIGKPVCIYSASEDDGAGRRDREDYRQITFIG